MSGGRCRTSGAAMPIPSVTLCSVKPRIRKTPSGGLAQGEGGADGQPLAQVVQTDAERDLIGQGQWALVSAPLLASADCSG